MTNEEKKVIQEIMQDIKCTEDEALAIYELEKKAKENGTEKQYAQSKKPRAKTQRTKKIDEEKKFLIEEIFDCLCDYDFSNLRIVNAEREIAFEYKGGNFSVNVVRHRPKK